MLQALQAEGHELGLHGGMDHVVWSRRFHELPDADSRGRRGASPTATSCGTSGSRPASPRPASTPTSASCAMLDRLGFLYNGDAIGGEPRRATADGRTLRHWTIPVTLCGPAHDPVSGIPWRPRHAGGRGAAPAGRASGAHEQVVLYGHPCYEGVREQVLRKVFAAGARARFPLRHHADARGAAADARRRSMIRVLSVFGTRPEAIKMAPVVQRACADAPDRFESVVCVSAQHRAMLDQVLDVFDLKADARPRSHGAGPVARPGSRRGVLERLPPLLRRDPARTSSWCRATR